MEMFVGSSARGRGVANSHGTNQLGCEVAPQIRPLAHQLRPPAAEALLHDGDTANVRFKSNCPFIVGAVIILLFGFIGIGEARAQQEMPDFSWCETGEPSAGYYCRDEGIAMQVVQKGVEEILAKLYASPWNSGLEWRACPVEISSYPTPVWGEMTKIYIRVVTTSQDCAIYGGADAADRRYPSSNTCAARPPRTLSYTMPSGSLQCTEGCAYMVSGNGDGTSTAVANGSVCTPSPPPLIDPEKNNQCEA